MGYSAEPMNTIFTESSRIIAGARKANDFEAAIGVSLRNLEYSSFPAGIVQQIKLEVRTRIEAQQAQQ